MLSHPGLQATRTDRGVHATGSVFSLILEKLPDDGTDDIQSTKWLDRLNQNLPADVGCPDVHSQLLPPPPPQLATNLTGAHLGCRAARAFGRWPVEGDFNAKRTCQTRRFEALLPVAALTPSQPTAAGGQDCRLVEVPAPLLARVGGGGGGGEEVTWDLEGGTITVVVVPGSPAVLLQADLRPSEPALRVPADGSAFLAVEWRQQRAGFDAPPAHVQLALQLEPGGWVAATVPVAAELCSAGHGAWELPSVRLTDTPDPMDTLWARLDTAQLEAGLDTAGAGPLPAGATVLAVGLLVSAGGPDERGRDGAPHVATLGGLRVVGAEQKAAAVAGAAVEEEEPVDAEAGPVESGGGGGLFACCMADPDATRPGSPPRVKVQLPPPASPGKRRRLAAAAAAAVARLQLVETVGGLLSRFENAGADARFHNFSHGVHAGATNSLWGGVERREGARGVEKQRRGRVGARAGAAAIALPRLSWVRLTRLALRLQVTSTEARAARRPGSCRVQRVVEIAGSAYIIVALQSPPVRAWRAIASAATPVAAC